MPNTFKARNNRWFVMFAAGLIKNEWLEQRSIVRSKTHRPPFRYITCSYNTCSIRHSQLTQVLRLLDNTSANYIDEQSYVRE